MKACLEAQGINLVVYFDIVKGVEYPHPCNERQYLTPPEPDTVEIKSICAECGQGNEIDITEAVDIEEFLLQFEDELLIAGAEYEKDDYI